MPRSVSRTSSGRSRSTSGESEEYLGGPDDLLEATLQAAEKLKTLLDGADGDLSNKVGEIKSELSVEIDKLARLRRAPPAKDDESTADKSPELIQYSCTSELAFVPWTEASSPGHAAREHVAIQIPSTQQTTEDLNPSKRHKKRDAITNNQKEALSEGCGSEPTVDKKRPFRRQGLPRDSHPLEELPDRIRICSQRLAIFLDASINGGFPKRILGNGGTLTILRPFKLLVEKGDDIREELARLEQVWESRFPGVTEDTDDSVYKADYSNLPWYSVATNQITLNQNDFMGIIKDIRCLIAFMDGYIAPSLKIGEIDHVYFSDLWFVFTARSLIYMRDKKVPQKVWKVIQRTGGHSHYDTGPDEDERTGRPAGDRSQRGGRHPFVIDCFHLDYDGLRYVQTYTQVYIDYFEDCQPLASLPVMPLRVAEGEGLIDRGAVVARGREFASCTQPQHKHYVGRHQTLRPNGLQLHERDEQAPENAARYPEWIESEVMVDFERALQEMPGWRPGLDELKLFKAAAPTRVGTDTGNIWDSRLSAQVIYEEREKCQRWDKERTGPSEEDDLLLLPDRVFAFVFRTRKWACLKLGKDSDGEEMLREKKCRPEPWNDLQLPDGHKRLVQSLIESHTSKEGPRSLHFDLVRAKGKGVTILLHGVPGVGKTSTAECAAEANNRPLLPITCGDLGAKPREVEKKLEEAFQLAQLWSCVLLLDEADIFLAQRNESDIHRNALVSVFLRVLEYYEGILFLTTNRVGVFDEAFKSRIHLPLYYPPLEWKYTKKIWHTHLLKLDRSGLVDVDVEDILAYAETFFENQSRRGSKIGPVWNGRQIRNAFQSAVALAGYRRGHGEGAGAQRIRIEREHFDRVAKTSNEFNHYIWSIKSATDADKAERLGIRLDGYQVDEMIHLKQHHTSPAPMGGVGGAGGGGGIAFGFSDRLTTMAAAQNMNPPPMNNSQFQGFTNTGFQSQQQGVPNSFPNNQQRMMPMQQQHHQFQNQQPTMANSFTSQQSMQPGFQTQQPPNDPSGFASQQQAMLANFQVQQPFGQEGVGQQAPYSQP